MVNKSTGRRKIKRKVKKERDFDKATGYLNEFRYNLYKIRSPACLSQ